MSPAPTQKRGATAEAIVADYMQERGYRIASRNFRSRFGEIDLIAVRRDLIVFVEVKARAGTRFGRGIDSVDIHKQRRIIQTARFYLTRYGTGRDRIRFDVVEVDTSHQPYEVADWYKAAFEVEA